MTGNGWEKLEWLEMADNVRKWLEMAPHGWTGLEMAEWLEMPGNG